jgi:hypothetical protein
VGISKRQARIGVLLGFSIVAVASASAISAASERGGDETTVGLPPASSLKTCAGLRVMIVVADGERVTGTEGNDVVVMDSSGHYSPNGGTDLICDGLGRVQSISVPEGEPVPATSTDVDQAVKELGGEP